ncbi:potassium/proton antiporter [Flavisolibacter tropicus]|uniref:Potassium transporter n=1 Tax=Flavisolibacter tropicus TaxID=1492898 RepID=A0A172TXZ0_9BACT|nr:potassium/proton antiporter [Flavisolibacter tropicus]ANE51744.1 potassium transporter [Flavisolibacter tropicus]
MHITPGNILFIGSILVLISVIASKSTSRFSVPTLILFLIIGALAGSEGIGGIHFDNPAVAQFIGITALVFILYSGGLDTNWQAVKPILWRGVALSTVGVLLTALAVGLFVHYVFNFSLFEGLLLGSIVSATDAAAVFSILRSKGMRLKGSLAPVLELESGSNDPMAYFLTVSLTSIVAIGKFNGWQLVFDFLQQFVLGAIVGYLMGRVSHWVINHIKLDAEGLYPVLLLGLAFFTYSATHAIGGNGFLAVYLSAIILGNQSFIHKRTLIRFYEGQAWLVQIILFLTLGLLVFPSRLFPVAGMGLLISAFLIFVARPISVFASLAFFPTNNRSKWFISWVGLRGGVPIVFATYPLLAGLDKAGVIFNLVFFISVTSVLLQGTTLPFVANLLHVAQPGPSKRKDGSSALEHVRSELKKIVIAPDSRAVDKQIVYLHIPLSVHILYIKRDGQYIQPVGATRIFANDTLYVLADNQKALEQTYAALGLEGEELSDDR